MSSWTLRAAAAAPMWFVVLLPALFTALPVLRVCRARQRRRRRVQRGQCGACGYDLRGAAHERCPECGQVVVALIEPHAVQT